MIDKSFVENEQWHLQPETKGRTAYEIALKNNMQLKMRIERVHMVDNYTVTGIGAGYLILTSIYRPHFLGRGGGFKTFHNSDVE